MSDKKRVVESLSQGKPYHMPLAKTEDLADAVYEAVNHPQHYGGGDNPYEAIKVIRANGWLEGFCLGSSLKYITRAGKKDPQKKIEDLKKAAWYINYYADDVDAENTKSS